MSRTLFAAGKIPPKSDRDAVDTYLSELKLKADALMKVALATGDGDMAREAQQAASRYRREYFECMAVPCPNCGGVKGNALVGWTAATHSTPSEAIYSDNCPTCGNKGAVLPEVADEYEEAR